MNAPKLPYETGVVFSADGTSIGYGRLGAGPGLIVISGGSLAAQYYMRLAGGLADAFTVYIAHLLRRELAAARSDPLVDRGQFAWRGSAIHDAGGLEEHQLTFLGCIRAVLGLRGTTKSWPGPNVTSSIPRS